MRRGDSQLEKAQMLASVKDTTLNLLVDDAIYTAIGSPFSNLITGYFEYHVNSHTLKVNSNVEPLFSLLIEKKEDDKKRKLFENESIEEILTTFAATKETQFTTELIISHTHKPWETFILKCNKVEKDDECYVCGLLIDITNRQKREMVDAQLDKLQALGQLTSGVSHDFNNQLNGILGYVALMKTMTEDLELLRYLDGIERAINHSTALTKQLLAFSHQSEHKKVNLDLVEIVNDIQSILEHTVDRRIAIDAQINVETCHIFGDSSQLHNAILNLCLNGRDAINGKGKISLILEKQQIDNLDDNLISTQLTPGEYAVLKVCDSGCGIAPELINKIFKPFFTTKQVGKGTGMGLAAVANTMKEHQGGVTIHSVVDKGTTFTLYMPLNVESEQMMNAEHIYKGTGRILLIDDELCNLEITHTLLESFGYDVVSCKNPEQAIEYYAKNPEAYDCILLDVIMPKMSGTEVFEALKLINPDSKVILLTGICEQSEVEFILRHGADAYVPKPVNQYALSYGVHKVLTTEAYEPNLLTLEQLMATETSLNLKAALSSIGNNVRLYLKVAHKFRKQFYMTVSHLSQLIEMNLPEALRTIHTIKGLASQLGADELYVYCKELEAGLANNLNVSSLVEIFNEEFIEVMDELARFEEIKTL